MPWPSLIRKRIALSILACALAPAAAHCADRVHGERSRTAPAAVLHWKLPDTKRAPRSVVRYPEINARRILEVSQKNSRAGNAPQQIGIARVAAREGVGDAPAPMHWMALPGGGSAARLEYTSPLALALRVGLRVDRLDPRVELRFAGSDRPDQVVAVMTGSRMKALADADGIFWTPSTDGQSQIIEAYRPRNVALAAAQLHSPMLSHLLANSPNSFIMAKALGEAAPCQSDTACKAATLGPGFVDAMASIALMQYVSSGATYRCSGTLIADKVASSQIPYFLAVTGCGQGGAANTLNTFWGYESTACRSGVARTPVQLVGGGEILVATADPGGSSILIRLNDPAPATAVFAGWDTAAPTSGQEVIGIHHPMGDVKKVVTGKMKGTSPYTHNVGWYGGGYMEPGSWGSGLFTADADGYHLRGIARNGRLTCSNTQNMSQYGNTQNYTRLDLFYPFARKWLSPDDPPILDFEYVIDRYTVTFTSRAQVAATSPIWMFSDLTRMEGETVVKTFPTSGEYRVTHSVTVMEGGESRDISVVRVVPIVQRTRVNGSQPRLPPQPAQSRLPKRAQGEWAGP